MTVSTGSVVGSAGGLCHLGVETVLVLHQALHVAGIGVLVAGQGNVLLTGEDILNLLDVHGVGAAVILADDGSGNACSLTGADALGDQVDVVDGDGVRRDVAAGSQNVLDLLGKNGAVGDLDGCIVVESVNGAVPCDAVIILLGECQSLAPMTCSPTMR